LHKNSNDAKLKRLNQRLQRQTIKKVRLVRYIKQNVAKIIHDVALAIERHNAMSTPILAVLL